MIRNRKPYDAFYLIILIVLIFFNGCDTENNIDPDYENYYVRFFGDQGSQEGVDLIVNESEQTVVLLGTTTEPGSSIKRIFLVKSDWHGNLIWKKKLGGPYDVAKDIELSNDGGFVILSESSEDTQLSNGVGFKLFKTTPEGEKSDSVFFKTPKDHPDDPIPGPVDSELHHCQPAGSSEFALGPCLAGNGQCLRHLPDPPVCRRDSA